MKAELCKTCIHTDVCTRDKNIVGDVFVMGHPMFFDNKELHKKFKEWEAKGFPCDMYLADPVKHGHWIKEEIPMPLSDGSKKCVRCSECGTHWEHGFKYCPNCGSKMEIE